MPVDLRAELKEILADLRIPEIGADTDGDGAANYCVGCYAAVGSPHGETCPVERLAKVAEYLPELLRSCADGVICLHKLHCVTCYRGDEDCNVFPRLLEFLRPLTGGEPSPAVLLPRAEVEQVREALRKSAQIVVRAGDPEPRPQRCGICSGLLAPSKAVLSHHCSMDCSGSFARSALALLDRGGKGDPNA